MNPVRISFNLSQNQDLYQFELSLEHLEANNQYKIVIPYRLLRTIEIKCNTNNIKVSVLQEEVDLLLISVFKDTMKCKIGIKCILRTLNTHPKIIRYNKPSLDKYNKIDKSKSYYEHQVINQNISNQFNFLSYHYFIIENEQQRKLAKNLIQLLPQYSYTLIIEYRDNLDIEEIINIPQILYFFSDNLFLNNINKFYRFIYGDQNNNSYYDSYFNRHNLESLSSQVNYLSFKSQSYPTVITNHKIDFNIPIIQINTINIDSDLHFSFIKSEDLLYQKRFKQIRSKTEGDLVYEVFFFSFDLDVQEYLLEIIEKRVSKIFESFKTEAIKDKRCIFSANLNFKRNGELKKSTIKKCTFNNKYQIELESIPYYLTAPATNKGVFGIFIFETYCK